MSITTNDPLFEEVCKEARRTTRTANTTTRKADSDWTYRRLATLGIGVFILLLFIIEWSGANGLQRMELRLERAEGSAEFVEASTLGLIITSDDNGNILLRNKSNVKAIEKMDLEEFRYNSDP